MGISGCGGLTVAAALNQLWHNATIYTQAYRKMTTDTEQEIAQAFIEQVRWTSDGLVPAIAQDAQTNEVLMFAWMNRESLALTVKEQRAIYWSRSRQKLWRKGEESGHQQLVNELRLDCDADVLLLSVEQHGGIACHTGRQSCFYRVYNDGQWQEVDAVIKDPAEIYKGGS
jgi:phosphoribosyl-AMP cyclohydrolase